MGRVTVVGLGPAGVDLLTDGTRRAIERIPVRFLRTARHPAAVAVPGARSFDDVYDTAASFDEVYRRIVDALVEASAEHGDVLYAVPGSPRVAERSVDLLVADGRAEVDVLPALSFLDLAWVRLGVDPLLAGVRIVDGRQFGVEAAGERGPLLVAQCDSRRVLSDIKLAVDDASDAPPVTVLHHLGLPDERLVEVPWHDLDRELEPDHLTSVWIPQLAAPVAGEVARFVELVRTLRERCPWDRQQTHHTLTRHLLEETYEVLEAIEGLDVDGPEHLEEELGDLLFQVVFHATLGAESGSFTLADVARGIHDKLVRRHPHVFAEGDAATAEDVVQRWEQIKKAEKGRASIMDGIPGDLPSLLYAHKVQRKAASVGVDPFVSEQLSAPVVSGGLSREEVGDVLFGIVAAARHREIDPEAALRGAAGRFRERFTALERLADERGIDLAAVDAATVDALWVEAGRPAP